MKTTKFTTAFGRYRHWFGVLLISLGMLCGLNGIKADQITELDRSHRSKNLALQTLLDRTVEAGLPEVYLRVMGLGVDFSGTAGYADLESAEPLTTEHKFFLASVTKTFTAVVALQLVNEGLLELNAPITVWLPPKITDGIPPAGQITLRQLLNHSSGLFDSDSNYLLLGLIIEKLTGTSLADQYRMRLFGPLQMTRNYLEWYKPAQGEGPVSHFFLSGRTRSWQHRSDRPLCKHLLGLGWRRTRFDREGAEPLHARPGIQRSV